MITIGQIGAGAWGQNHVRTFFGLKDCYLKACCDKNADVLSSVKENYYQKIETTEDHRDILNDKEIEAVVIAAPANLHAQLTTEALSAGKHVFVEKPLALNMADCKKINKAAKMNNKIVMVGHLLLYHPAILRLKDFCTSGELGDIHYIYSTRVNLGKVRHEENALWSLTAHDISVALFLLSDFPVEVTAKGESYLRKGIEDVVFVTLKFGNGILMHIHASWLDPHKMRKFTVVGSKKMAVFDDMEPAEKIRLYDKGVDRKNSGGMSYEDYLALRNGDICIPSIKMKEPLKLECQHFLDCIKDGSPPVTDINNGLDVVEVLEAAQLSLDRSGEAVKLKTRACSDLPAQIVKVEI